MNFQNQNIWIIGASSGKGIHVTLVCPGYIQTELTRHALIGDGRKYDKVDDSQQTRYARFPV